MITLKVTLPVGIEQTETLEINTIIVPVAPIEGEYKAAIDTAWVTADGAQYPLSRSPRAAYMESVVKTLVRAAWINGNARILEDK